ncbi:uncharacterized protein LOC135161141 isoform X2 [Diachasmimorpha longicaudata]|uniref:uncharacterized protein LOC135161141 isoform X2 n=1 Tax=Diachasmimorpha longicaudata TaxID=58733 RepID=UPI0030B908AE
MISPWTTVGVFAIGVILAISGYAFQQYRERRHCENPCRRSSPPRIASRGNLTCPICGQRIRRNTHAMVCGHQFHRSCYADRLLDNRDNEGMFYVRCPICGEVDGTELPDNQVPPVDGLTHRRIKCCYCSATLTHALSTQLSCGHFAHSECKEHYDDIMQCQNCLPTSTQTCIVCEIPILSSITNKEQLDCGHFAHSSCSSISKLIKCSQCPRTEEKPLE